MELKCEMDRHVECTRGISVYGMMLCHYCGLDRRRLTGKTLTPEMAKADQAIYCLPAKARIA